MLSLIKKKRKNRHNTKKAKGLVCLCCSVCLINTALSQTISGHIENGASTQMIYLYYYPDLMGYKDTKIKEDSSEITNGYFHFVFDPGETPRYARLEQRRAQGKNGTAYLGSLDLFLTNDSILIKTKDSLIDARIYNSQVNYDYLILKELIAPAKKKLLDLENKLQKDYSETPISILSSKEYQRFRTNRLELANKELSAAYESFIETLPNSWVSLYAFVKRSRASHFLTPQIKELYEKLGKELRSSEIGMAFGERFSKKMLLQPGSPAPGFSLPNVNENIVNLSDYLGKYVLLEFWSTSCGACRAEAPNLKEAWTKYKNVQFDIFSVSLDNLRYVKRERWLDAIKLDGTGLWQQVCDFKGWDSPVAITYDIKSIPQNYLIGPDGRIISENLKGADLHDKLKEIFGF